MQDTTSQPDNTHAHEHPPSFWLWVLCLTGVDYFSTLGYQPSIAFEAAGLLAPLATIVLVLVTLLGALPVYSYVAGESFKGQGSIAMLERLVHGWRGKFLILALLGFGATDYIITKTLSAADAAEHLIHNPYWKNAPAWLHGQVPVTMILLVLLGGVFLRGFREVIGIAVALTAVYLTLNAIVIGCSLAYLVQHPELIQAWQDAVFVKGEWQVHDLPLAGRDLFSMCVLCLILFPKLALGLSGFETGVAVMPLIRGNPDDAPDKPLGRIRNARKMLATAAIIMSCYLIGSAIITAMLIPPGELMTNGHASNRALAFLAHGESPVPISGLFGDAFGTLYDVSTVTILWFAGASAMSGLLNLVPRYLPRFGMAPEWAAALRPLVFFFTAVNLFVTWMFDADVNAQGGAYATGVMVLICSACVAVVIDTWEKSKGRTRLVRLLIASVWVFISGVFFYTTAAIIVQKPEGLMIATFFITAVIGVSMASRVLRTTELRFVRFRFATPESQFLWDSLRHLEFPVLVPHRPGRHSLAEKEAIIRRDHRLTPDVPIVFIEAVVGDASEFLQSPMMEITSQEGRFILRVINCVSIAHVLTTLALELSKTGRPPELHFGWSDENPLATNLRFVLFGEGNVPWIVRQLLIKGEPDPDRRPRVIVG